MSFLIAGDNIFTIETTLPARFRRRREAAVVETSPRRAPGSSVPRSPSSLAAEGRRAPILETQWKARKDEPITPYEPKAELADGPKLPRLEMLKKQARTLRGKAESKDEFGRLLTQISELERQVYIAADVLTAAATLVEDNEQSQISQAELSQAKTLLRGLIAEATA